MIACASDNRYALPLAVMLRSLAANLAPNCQVEVYAVEDGVGPAEKALVLASLTDRITLRGVGWEVGRTRSELEPESYDRTFDFSSKKTKGNSASLQQPAEIRIAHFSGNLKPWNSGGSSLYHNLYFKYLDQTAWSGWRPARTWKGMALEAYESSRLRRFVYPAEQWATQLVRTFTRN